ncbi:MAG: squalene--hopene cyclase [Planctomycetia bacterium]|nr:squalene--hopene cyclase [Planctomycetia bacterium]
MCNEARGLWGWPRKAARWIALVAAAALALGALAGSLNLPVRGDEPSPTPNSPDEPLAPTLSLAASGSFLDAVALDWTRKRQCGTCHTNYAYLIARPALKDKDGPSPASTEVRTFFEGRVAHWDDPAKSAKPRWDAEVVATAASLALNDAATTGTLHPLTRRALDRAWTLQKADGSWSWLKCDWPPFEHDDYYGAVFAALGVGSAPDGYAKTEAARAGLDRLRGYLKTHPAPDLHHQTFLLWTSTRLDGLMTPHEQAETVASLRALQRADGGWCLPSLGDWKRRDGSPNDKDAPSDGYATGLVVYVLRQSGTPADDPAVRRGADWLATHQRASGRWFTRSLNTDKAHYIANAGTGFAVLALSACGRAD